MANRLKKVMEPLLNVAYKSGDEQGVEEGYQKKILAYENESVYLKSILKAQHELLPEWIPATEMLPEEEDASEHGYVLVYTKNNEHLITGYQDVWRFRDFITYWMPLPEPPKENTR